MKCWLSSKIDDSPKFGKSIREKSTQYFIDSKLCRLNSGHPQRLDCYQSNGAHDWDRQAHAEGPAGRLLLAGHVGVVVRNLHCQAGQLVVGGFNLETNWSFNQQHLKDCFKQKGKLKLSCLQSRILIETHTREGKVRKLVLKTIFY